MNIKDREVTVEQLEQKARTLRRHIVRMIGVGKKGHLGGPCSIADVVSVLSFHTIKLDPTNPRWATFP